LTGDAAPGIRDGFQPFDRDQLSTRLAGPIAALPDFLQRIQDTLFNQSLPAQSIESQVHFGLNSNSLKKWSIDSFSHPRKGSLESGWNKFDSFDRII
jgi:hypothetical protein